MKEMRRSEKTVLSEIRKKENKLILFEELRREIRKEENEKERNVKKGEK